MYTIITNQQTFKASAWKKSLGQTLPLGMNPYTQEADKYIRYLITFDHKEDLSFDSREERDDAYDQIADLITEGRTILDVRIGEL